MYVYKNSTTGLAEKSLFVGYLVHNFHSGPFKTKIAWRQKDINSRIQIKSYPTEGAWSCDIKSNQPMVFNPLIVYTASNSVQDVPVTFELNYQYYFHIHMEDKWIISMIHVSTFLFSN